jgi:hypothetical protein
MVSMQRTCPFDAQITKLPDVVRAMREHPIKMSSLVENGIRIRLFKDRLLCDNYLCEKIRRFGEGDALSCCGRMEENNGK